MTSHCKRVGGSGKNLNELVKAEVEEKAETSLQLKVRVSSGLTVIAVGVWAGEPRPGSSSAKIILQLHQPQAECESTSSSLWLRKATASAWAGQRGRRKEKQSFPSALGHSLLYTLGCSISRACKESKEDLGLLSLENRRHLGLAFEEQKNNS